jgi:hypothetical protein
MTLGPRPPSGTVRKPTKAQQDAQTRRKSSAFRYGVSASYKPTSYCRLNFLQRHIQLLLQYINSTFALYTTTPSSFTKSSRRHFHHVAGKLCGNLPILKEIALYVRGNTVFGYPSHICFRFSDTSLDRGRISLISFVCVTHLTLSWFQLADTPICAFGDHITKHILFILVGRQRMGKGCFFLDTQEDIAWVQVLDLLGFLL